MQATESGFWSTAQVAAYLGVPESTVRYWNWQGSGPRSYKLGRRRKYKPSEVKAWAEAQAEKPDQASAQASRRRLSRT
jgi:excisionase family DNA binding protein